MLAILRSVPAFLVICITFVLCCVEAVQNDQEKQENGDGGVQEPVLETELPLFVVTTFNVADYNNVSPTYDRKKKTKEKKETKKTNQNQPG